MSVSRSGDDATNRYQFLGKEKQPETGYIDLQARFYDPTIGRFFNVDPETEGQLEFSPYHYSFNNPIRFSDPDGRFPDCCGGAIDFLSGVGSALNDNMFGGSPVKASPGYVDAYNSGRTAGHYLSMAVGAAETVAGGLGLLGSGVAEVGSLGTATPAVVVAGAGWIALAGHGLNTANNAVGNLRNDKGRVNAEGGSNNGSKQRNKPQETGTPNSSEIQSRDKVGKTDKYTTYDEKGKMVKEYRGSGKDHGNIPRPNVKEPQYNTNPKTGEKFQNGYEVRKAKLEEIPK